MTDPDSELEDDEEEILVYVEFDNFATNDVFSSENLKLDMLGIDSDNPVMQINGKFFEGNYEDAVGTYLFFEKDYHPDYDDHIFDKIPTWKYFNKTRKVLKMQRAFMIPRNEVLGDSKHPKCIPNEETLIEAGVPPKYREQALSFWQQSRNFRQEELQKYLKKQEFRKELRLRGFEPESESDEENPFAMYKAQVDEINDNETDQVNYGSQVDNLEVELHEDEPMDKSPPVASRKLTVIDPGPSTSKNSRPWISDDEVNEVDGSNDDTEWVPFAKKVKSVGKGRGKRTMKSKTDHKISNKKTSPNQSNTNTNQSPLSPKISRVISEIENNLAEDDEMQNNLAENQEIEKSNETSKSGNNTKKKKAWTPKMTEVEEMEVSEVGPIESDRLLSEELNLEFNLEETKKLRKQNRREAKMNEIRKRLESLKTEITSQEKS